MFMTKLDLDDVRAVEATVTAMSGLKTRDMVRVLLWIIDKFDLALDMKLALRDVRPATRNYIDLAWEKSPDAMHSPNEFLAAAAPETHVDRVLTIATYLQMGAEDPDEAKLTGKEINEVLRRMKLGVANISDVMNTLMRRNPPHMVETGPLPVRKDWKGYRVTEAGIDHVYKLIVEQQPYEGISRQSR